MADENASPTGAPSLQQLFGVPERCDLRSDYIRQVASQGLRTGKLTETQIKELCGSVMEHIAKRE